MGSVYLLKAPAGLCYVGSSRRALPTRLSMHRANYRRWLRGVGKWCSSFPVLEEGGDDVTIEAYEDRPLDDACQLRRREGQVIRGMACTNSNVAGRTPREYYEHHRVHILERAKARYALGGEREKRRQYYLANQDRLKEMSLARYYANKTV